MRHSGIRGRREIKLIIFSHRRQPRNAQPATIKEVGVAVTRPECISYYRKRTKRPVRVGPAGELVCLTVYKRGAEEVVRRLAA